MDKVIDLIMLPTQHLYFLSDEKIKEGNWVLDTLNKKVFKAEHDVDYEQNHVFKIIATDDKSIAIDGYDSSDKDSIVECYLPQPSKEFIELYCKRHNEGNPITKVIVEYNEQYLSYNPVIKVNPGNTINIKLIKDSWSRGEVIDLCRKAHLHGKKTYKNKLRYE